MRLISYVSKIDDSNANFLFFIKFNSFYADFFMWLIKLISMLSKDQLFLFT